MEMFKAILHIDQYLLGWTQQYGVWLYAIVFGIVFCETGLVVLPFLPGDSMLFALGALTTVENTSLNLLNLSLILILAAFCGDNLNYQIGRKIGVSIFQDPKRKFLNPESLRRTQNFCERYGVKAILFARFIPIVRTFVPFVAGVGKMPYRSFIGFSLLASVLWTQTFLWLGAAFGNLPNVKKNFEFVILGIIFVSILPPIWTWLRARWIARKQPVSE